MKKLATLLAVLLLVAGASAANIGNMAGGVETTVVEPGTDTCVQTLYQNHDGSFENGFCWQYGGIAPPYYGAFAEGFTGLGTGYVECMAIWATQVGNYFGQTCDIYIWQGGVSGAPSTVLWQGTGAFTSIPYWPTVGRNDFNVGFCLEGDFAVGYWVDASASVCPWYVGADLDGFGGYPWTNVAAGTGYPTGWQHPGVVWTSYYPQSLGFGVFFQAGMTPVEAATWGQIKNLF